MSAKVLRLPATDGNVGGWMAHCPACGCGHLFDDQRWTFNGDKERPTFVPSMLSSGVPGTTLKRCHSFLRDGVWEYLSDSEHLMRGQNVPAPDLE